MRRNNSICLAVGLIPFLAVASASAQTGFVHWETPHVHPIDLTPSGNRLLAVNIADNRLEIFNVLPAGLTPVASISVGLDPVSVRARSETEAWVANHVSDTISIVDLATLRVTRTIFTGDEPCDIVFAGTPQRAFVSVSQLNQIRVYDPVTPLAAATILNIEGEDPRALAVSPDGTRVYAAIFESGNATGIVRQQDVSSGPSPYAGLNPPPNAGNLFSPPINPAIFPPPPGGMIVRRNATGQWFDGNARNWSSFITWNLHDHDVAIINTATLGLTYSTGLMTSLMGLGVKPDGTVTAIGTEATNEVRFEPNVRSTFIRVRMGAFNPATPLTTTITDLNPHLNYAQQSIPQASRDLSIGDPRGIVWHPTSGNAYITGMGSNNVIVVSGAGVRLAQIDVGEGPTGLSLSSDASRLFAMNKFDGSISIIDTATNAELTRVSFFDPTPAAVKLGRPLLYDTHLTSGLGHVSCASCHIDGRTDFLAWDLGNPAGTIKPFNQDCRTPTCRDWNPMKGPMVTQSLQNIIGNEPLHWRGDREDLAAFGPAFTDLQGADTIPSAGMLQQFTDFIATIKYPPNPNRNFDGTLPPTRPVSAGGMGNPTTGQNLYNTLPVLGGNTTCNSCHTLPTGTSGEIDDPMLPLAPQSMKIAQLRGMHEKDGWRRNSMNNSKGFGFNHDSDFDSLNALLQVGFNFGAPAVAQQRRFDVEAFLLCLNTDTHASVGQQVTFFGPNNNDANPTTRLSAFIALGNSGTVGLIAHGRVAGQDRGYYYTGAGIMQSDRHGEIVAADSLRTGASNGNEITFTVVAAGTQLRMGIDRDVDGAYDFEELVGCGDPANAAILPVPKADLNGDTLKNADDVPLMASALVDPTSATTLQLCAADMNADGRIDGRDITLFTRCVMGQGCP